MMVAGIEKVGIQLGIVESPRMRVAKVRTMWVRRIAAAIDGEGGA